MKDVYQKLMDTTDYGKHEKNKCPGAKFFPMFEKFIDPPVMDLGCGTGDTVRLLKSKGIFADGIDWVNLNNDMMVRDITQPIDMFGYNTALCIDVLEHIPEEKVHVLLFNIAQCKKAVVSVHTGSSIFCDDIELHITQHSFKWWERKLKERWRIVKEHLINYERKLYLLEKK